MVVEAWLLAENPEKLTNFNTRDPNVKISPTELEKEIGIILIEVNLYFRFTFSMLQID